MRLSDLTLRELLNQITNVPVDIVTETFEIGASFQTKAWFYS